MIQNRPPDRHVQLALGQPHKPVVGRPGVEEIAVHRHPLGKRVHEPLGQAVIAEEQPSQPQLVAGIAAVLLALAPAAILQRVLIAVAQRVDRGLEQPLQTRLVRLDHRQEGKSIQPPAEARPLDPHPPGGIANMHLYPLAALVIEGLEIVSPLAANQPRPVIKIRIKPGGAVDRIVSFLNHDFDDRARGRIHLEHRPARHVFRQFVGEKHAFSVFRQHRDARRIGA